MPFSFARRTIICTAPSKTFNVAGLACSVGVVQNPDLRARLEQARAGLVPEVNVLGYTAGLAAYQGLQVAILLALLGLGGALSPAGTLLLIDETPREGAHGTRVAFLHPKSLGGVLLGAPTVPKINSFVMSSSVRIQV